jgi:hypothetical protein
MIIRNALIIILVSVSVSGFSQYSKDTTDTNDKVPFKDRLYYDGNFNFAVGTNTFINISPRIGYKITENFSAGLGGKFWYFSSRDFFSNTRYSGSLYGGGVFARRNITDNLFLISEYEVLNLGGLFSQPRQDFWQEFLFAGAGYQYRMGGALNLYVIAMYDIFQNPYAYSIYPTIPIAGVPIMLRLGVSMGI